MEIEIEAREVIIEQRPAAAEGPPEMGCRVALLDAFAEGAERLPPDIFDRPAAETGGGVPSYVAGIRGGFTISKHR